MSSLPVPRTETTDFSLPGVMHRASIRGAECTTFAIGGPCTALYDISSCDALRAMLRALQQQSRSYRILGAGSNLVIPDEGVVDVIVRLTGEFRSIQLHGERVQAGAAASMMTLSRNTADGGLAGFEFAAGIPGSVGGGVRMNAGAHQGCFADVVEAVQAVLPSGETVTLSNSELGFAYRHSSLPEGAIVISAVLRLCPSDPAKIRERRAALLAERKATQPLTDPCAGSVFKNPQGHPAAAKLIEQCGLKGSWEGGVCVSPRHANWIVNPGRKGTAEDVRTLVSRVQKVVHLDRQVALEPEIIFW
ncbi:MAG: UDP-N-acetylmuramate dehydrogenase [Bdellovibrionota bacterium]|nr:MAG: UDP-N-acetylmuramate dehydrogenase [Bdellovibrionota bacterium]